MSRGIREFMEAEHNFGPYSDKDDGSHRPGRTTVLLEGDTATRDALSPQEGALYLLDDGEFLQLQGYFSGAWTDIATLDHGELSDLVVGNPHPQYILNVEGELSGDADSLLDMNGNQVHVEVYSESFAGMTLYRHRSQEHPSLGSHSVIKDGAVPISYLVNRQVSWAGEIGGLTTVIFSLPSSAAVLAPNLYSDDPDSVLITTGIPGEFGFGIRNDTIGAVDVSIRANRLD